MLHAQQAHMLRQNKRAKTKRPKWRPQIGETMWVMRHDTNVPNRTLSQMWEKGVVLHPTGPSTFKIRCKGRAKHKNKMLNLQQLRPCANDVQEADANLNDDLPPAY